MIHPNLRAFLDMIAWSELGTGLIALSDNGYNVIVGSTPKKPILFPSLPDGTPDYRDHPRRSMKVGNIISTAAGRYQLLSRYYDAYKAQLRLPDFSPASQDAIAIQQIKERKALQPIFNGDPHEAIYRARNIWASFPGSPYGQHTNTSESMEAAYVAAGGIVEV